MRVEISYGEAISSDEASIFGIEDGSSFTDVVGLQIVGVIDPAHCSDSFDYKKFSDIL